MESTSEIEKEALSRISEFKTEGKKRKYVTICSAIGYEGARRILEGLPSAQQWIPCSERLPDDEGYYLTTTEFGGVYCDYWDSIRWDRTERVIAWMELPKPWEGEQDERSD